MKIKNKNLLLFLFFLCFGILLTLYVEYKFQYSQFKWLGFRVLIISAAVVEYGLLSQKIRKKYYSLIIKTLIFFIFFYLTIFFANLINIYHLDKFEQVNNFCFNKPKVCESITINFYKFKIYRFVSLTSYFFYYVIFFLIGMIFSEKISYKVNKNWKKIPKVKIPKVKLKYAWLFYFLMTYLLFQQLVLVFSIMSKKTVKMFSALSVPYEERWEAGMGGRYSFGWMATYGDFVNSHTEEKSTILIPEQTAPWEMEGNPFYVRWFFYPRRTIQMKGSKEIPEKAQYVLITNGVFGYQKSIFPNFPISKEKIKKIILVDRATLENIVISSQDYYPEDFENKWGIIELK